MAVTTIPNERGISFEKLEKLFEEDIKTPVTENADYREAIEGNGRLEEQVAQIFLYRFPHFIGALMEVWKENCDD
ncbi:MAG: hypothetical protein V8R46_08440 [Eubacterium ramulus]